MSVTEVEPDEEAPKPAAPHVQSRRRRRRLTIAGAVVGLAFIAFLVVTWRLFISPPTDDLTTAQADAIVVFAGGGPRVVEGLRLVMDEGVADTLVVARNTEPGLPFQAHFELCDTGRPIGAHCFQPEPRTTRGEAQYVAALAEREGWETIVLVTSTDQLVRARMMIERCWDGEVLVTDVWHNQWAPLRAVYEWGAMLKAQTLNRGCGEGGEEPGQEWPSEAANQ
ncbi:MAG: YdcF family protein [Actinomycetia bacterium]|nr:YdcF family protein [Actinomycetes bacterium]